VTADDPLLSRIDHLVYATPDLEAATDALEARLGVAATPGGRHPGRGTRNALFGLGPHSYLEVIGPDDGQPAGAKPRWFGIDHLAAPRLATWAAKGTGLADLVARAAQHGVRLGAVAGGSRERPDGTMLLWSLTDPGTVIADGLVPFFIDWGDRPHPAAALPPGLRLAELRAEHPGAGEVRRILSALGLALPVADGPRPALIATIGGAKGPIELR
jgi:Glyoxalase-like domain